MPGHPPTLRLGELLIRENTAYRLHDLLVVQAVVNANGSRSLAAHCLGLSRATVYRAMERYALRCAREATKPVMEFC